jgi:hypothetical protein
LNGSKWSTQDWLVVSTPLKNMKVSWDYYSQYMESHKIHVPNQQPVIEWFRMIDTINLCLLAKCRLFCVRLKISPPKKDGSQYRKSRTLWVHLYPNLIRAIIYIYVDAWLRYVLNS